MNEEMPIKMLKNDHRKVEELFNECRSLKDPEERAKKIRKIVKELDIHTEVEEHYIYPEIEKISSEGMEMISHSRIEHQEMKNILGKLRDIERASATDDENLNRLETTVLEHVNEEEQKVFTFAQKHLESELGIGLSAKMLVLKEKLRIQK